MFYRHLRFLCMAIIAVGALSARAEAQLTESLVDKFNALLPLDHSRPLPIPELCHRLDCLAEEMRDDGA